MTLTELNWKSEKPIVRGLYWRRNGKHDKPHLMFVFKGPHGLVARTVDEPNWHHNEPVERLVESFVSGQWAGPLAPPEK